MKNQFAIYSAQLVFGIATFISFSTAAHAFGISAPFDVKRAPVGISTVDHSTTSITPSPVRMPASSTFKAYWNDKNPNGAQWTAYAQDAIAKYGSALIRGSSDVASFCPNFDRLGTQDRIDFWVQLLAAMTKYESGFNPASRMVETTMPNDPTTGAPTSSEGLLQLSYSDEQVFKHSVPTDVCNFDYQSDRQYRVTDIRRSILDPKNNITCAVGILNHQVQKYDLIATGAPAYWAVIKTNRSTNKLAAIRAITRSLAFCN